MKFCPVVPPACATETLPTPPHGMFAFATHCYSTRMPTPRYGDFFRSWNATALQDERGPLVMDCPIYEGGDHLGVWELAEIERFMHPHFLIVPDVRQDMRATINRFLEYFTLLGGAATGVLQGKTWIELEKCFDVMRVATNKIAIPKDVAKFDVSRYELITQIVAIQPDIEIHLLGGDWPYVDEGKCARFPQVKSMDSAEPFNAALVGLDLAKSPPPPRPKDWLATTEKNLGDGFVRDFWRNIETVERLAKCS